MVRLGVGKNMVRAIRCWVTAAGIAAADRARSMTVTTFGKAVLGPGGYDEFLEDVQTLWLIHWRLSTQAQEPLFAWHYLLNKWNQPEFTRSEVLTAFSKETEREARPLSSVTLEEHFTVFVHTYVPARKGKRELIEDSLDCPLVELEFIQEVGERSDPKTGRREKIYGFRTEEKPDISPELFAYCVNDFWTARHQLEKTLTCSQLSVGECSPGQVLRLPEHSIRERLECIEQDSHGVFAYQESSAMQQIVRKSNSSAAALLKKVYRHK